MRPTNAILVQIVTDQPVASRCHSRYVLFTGGPGNDTK